MPLYVYQCSQCGHEAEEFFHIRSIPDDVFCPQCDSKMGRVPCRIGTPLAEYGKPIEMHSVALCHPDDIAAFKRRYPDIECSTKPDDPLYGVPVAKSRAQKLQVLRGEGWEERS